MNNLYRIFLVLFITTFFTSCFEDLDDNAIASKDIKDFVWSGMNHFYYYKDNVPDLANDRFASNSEYSQYLNDFSSPEELFGNLLYDPENVDRFSWITNDYIALEQQFNGIIKSSGYEIDFYPVPGNDSAVFGIVRLVLPNSPAASLGLQRGQIIDAVNGITLNDTNKNTLFRPNSYTIHLANYNNNGTPNDTTDDTIDSTTDTVTLNKETITENPIYITDVFTVNNAKVGYLMYNGFNANYNNQLNAAFANFQAENIQHMVVDLRYNPGGSVNTAMLLGSMLTGQFNGEIFTKLEYNDNLQNNNSTYNFSSSFDGNSINSLQLPKVYILTTGNSASASEMLINSLQAYAQLEIIHIGEQTVGKSQASITVYDSPDYGRNGANPNHTYALQPLVAKTFNKNDVSVPANGLTPLIPVVENPMNYGVLGNENEPLLATALQHILDNGRFSNLPQHTYKRLAHKNNEKPFEKDMYID
ncbi:MAG: S41 family peptidase [Oceanihabitans sp.]